MAGSNHFSADLLNLALFAFVLGVFHSQTELQFDSGSLAIASHQLWLCKRAHRNLQAEVYCIALNFRGSKFLRIAILKTSLK